MAYKKGWRHIAKKYGRQAINYGVKRLGQYAKDKVKGNSKRSTHDYGGITTQHDSKTIYRSKKMPYRKKKKWVAFVRKVSAVEISNRAKSTFVINSANTVTTAADNQAWSETHIYSQKGTDVGTRDIQYLLEDANLYQKVQSTGLVTSSNDIIVGGTFADESTRKEILLSSASLDVTYTNTSTEGQGMEMDLYTIIYSRQTGGYHGSFLAEVDSNTTTVGAIPILTSPTNISLTSQITKAQRGITLFEMPYGLSKCGAKIVKKEKYFISSGNSITKNVRDPKNHPLRLVSGEPVFQKRGITQTLVACIKPVNPGAIVSLSTKSTRSYKYTYEGGALPFNRYKTE